MDEEAARRAAIDKRSEVNEQMTRRKSIKIAEKAVDEEAARRAAMDKRTEMNEQMTREKNIKELIINAGPIGVVCVNCSAI